METFYFISDMRVIRESYFILTVEDTLFKVYAFDGTSSLTETVSHNMIKSLYAVEYELSTSRVFVGGFEIAKVLDIESTAVSQCHQSCAGGCTKAFSPSSCATCDVGITANAAGVCLRDTPTLPPDH